MEPLALVPLDAAVDAFKKLLEPLEKKIVDAVTALERENAALRRELNRLRAERN